MEQLYKKIRYLLDTLPDCSQRGLAQHMGLDPAAVNRLIHGRRAIKADEIPRIESYFGQALLPAATLPAAPLSASLLPVYALEDIGGGVMDQTACPPALIGAIGAFAVYIPDDQFAPRYFSGEIVYIHPARPPKSGQDLLLVFSQGGVKRTDICRLISAAVPAAGGENILHFYAESTQKKIARQDCQAIYSIVGRG